MISDQSLNDTIDMNTASEVEAWLEKGHALARQVPRAKWERIENLE